MSDFRFAEPGWGLLLWVVLAFTGLLAWLEFRAGSTLARFLSPLMQSRLAATPSAARRRTAMGLLGLSLVLAVFALMRPQWGVQLISTPRVGAEIMVCLDVSNSMLAEDVAPNRLERAKAEVRDLLTYLHGDSVGLIAFAGRASVLSPITPDFSFLRLVLDSAGPKSVARGGTRLEEPIRKAVAGFGTGASVSRSILLITDGEDHDSFPLEAAKEAAERGIKILSIGFGDEKGSPIQISDPKTGAKKTLRDSSGQEVVSRLDGETLRQIALATDGAYIPAGTGVLDLQSIYDTHIAGLTRGNLDGETRTIRKEAYQAAVLASLLSLMASVVVAAGRRAGSAGLGLLLLAMPTLAPGRVQAADSVVSDEVPAEHAAQAATPAGNAAANPDAVAVAKAPEKEAPPPARETYNSALDKLGSGDLDGAEKMLEDARTRAGFDGLLRRDATYNLGILDARRADAKMEAAPEEALSALERSAAWFRETVSLDAKDDDARHNLELVLRRALVLADAIAKKKQKGLIDDITALMDEQRAFLGTLRKTVQADAGGGGTDPGRDRAAFRDLATKQLELSAKAEDVSERAGREQTLLKNKPADQQTPQEQMQAVQLDGVGEALHQAREQMGQARGRLRRIEGPGGYRAASTSLTDLKRARDRLLDPIKVLDILVADATELVRLTGMKMELDSGQAKAPPQKWLTPDHLADTAGELRERVEELHYNFVTVLSQGTAAAQTQQGVATPAAPGTDPDAEKAQQAAGLLERVKEAEPLIGEAVTATADARTQLDEQKVREALEPEYKAVAKLAAARESFLDLQRLIDLLHTDEKRIESVVSPQAVRSESGPAEAAAPNAEYAPMAAELQSTNAARIPNVERALKDEIAKAEAAAQQKAAQAQQQQQPGGAQATPAPAPQGPDPEAEKQRLELAQTYLTAARGAVDEATRTLDDLASRASAQADALPDTLPGAPPLDAWQPSQAAVKEAVARIEDLRRLFFSVIDHLKELAQRQLELGDQTEEVAATAQAAPNEDHTAKAGPLSAKQQSLSTTAAPIADALREQASQPIPPEAADKVPADLPQKMTEAATHVDNARAAMDVASGHLDINPPAFADTRASQNTAIQELATAIQLLTPPEQQQQQQDKQKDQQQKEEQKQDQQQQRQAGQKGQKDEQAEKEKTDPAQLLQGIRDREAERRANRDKAEKHGYDPVEKDW